MTGENGVKPADTTRWHHIETVIELQAMVATHIIALANTCIKQHGRFSIVLAGGETPRAIYTQLRNCKTDWQQWHVYFGDERCLPMNDPQRNDSMAFNTLLQHAPIPTANIHRIPADVPPEIAAQQYAKTLESVPQFDLVLLGVGEDGHTASLFPENPWGTTPDSASVLVVQNAPKPPPDRITLSANRLSAARAVWFMVSSDNKRDALRRWQAGESIPARAIRPANGVDMFTSVVTE